MTSLSEELLTALIRPMPKAKYEVEYGLAFLEEGLAMFAGGATLNLVPDFQRGHVWTQEQQERWIEALLRGAISSSGRLIQFNAPAWNNAPTGDLSSEVTCVDGLQRLTAARRFMNGEIRAFGYTAAELDGTSFSPKRFRMIFSVHEFQQREDLLQYYLDLNAGGTPHRQEEIDRVRDLLAAARQQKTAKAA